MISGTDQREIYQISSRRPEDQTGNGRPENQEKTGFKPMILYIFFDTLYQLHLLPVILNNEPGTEENRITDDIEQETERQKERQ